MDTFDKEGQMKYLFIDDFHLERLDNLARKLHQPEKFPGYAVVRPEHRWENQTCQLRNTPVWDGEAGCYKMAYCGKGEALDPELVVDRTGAMPKTALMCYATSNDGIHWDKPEMGMHDYPGLTWDGKRIGTRNNVIYPCPSLFAVLDPNEEDPGRRFKGMVYRDRALHPVASADHVHWEDLGYPPSSSADQSHFTLDAEKGLFIATVKHRGPYGRSWYLTTSEDFRNWSEQELVFHADQVDQENGHRRLRRFFEDSAYLTPVYNRPEEWRTDVYNFPVFPYEGIYLGLPVLQHWSGKHAPLYENVDSRKSVELTSSRDLRNWERVANRAPFLELSGLEDGGVYDTGQIVTSNGPLVRGDQLLFYYSGIRSRSATPAEEQNHAGLDQGAICMARLRLDGFVSLKGGAEPGSLLTRAVEITGSELRINADSWRGQVRTEIVDPEEDRPLPGFSLEESVPLEADRVDAAVRWKGAGDLGALRGRTVRIRFSMRQAELYAFWFAGEGS